MHWPISRGGAGLGSRASLLAAAVCLLPAAARAQIPIPVPLLTDSFESGDLSAWSSAATGGGDLSVTTSAALAGTYGLQGVVNDLSGLYVQDDTPDEESYFSARFTLDPNGFDPGEAQLHRRVRVFIAFEDAPQRRLTTVVLRRVNGQYGLQARVRQDDNSQVDTPFIDITDDPHTIEIHWRRASGPDANNGFLRLSIDFVERAVLSGIDNNAAVDFARLGVMSVKAGANGTLYWDNFQDWRDLAPAHAQLVINEVDYDQPGFSGDQGEFVEIYNPGPAPTPLDGVALMQFDGVDNNAYRTIALNVGGTTLAPGQYLVVANTSVTVAPGSLIIRYAVPLENIQDGGSPGNFHADGLLLVYPTTCHHLDALSYEGNLFSVNGPCGPTPLKEGLASLFAEDNSVSAGSLIRNPNGSDTDEAATDWAFTATPTPGSANVP